MSSNLFWKGLISPETNLGSYFIQFYGVKHELRLRYMFGYASRYISSVVGGLICIAFCASGIMALMLTLLLNLNVHTLEGGNPPQYYDTILGLFLVMLLCIVGLKTTYI
jgi:hypothetical protein